MPKDVAQAEAAQVSSMHSGNQKAFTITRTLASKNTRTNECTQWYIILAACGTWGLYAGTYGPALAAIFGTLHSARFHPQATGACSPVIV